MNYEIEQRALLSREQYEKLYYFLSKETDIETDNKDVYFFISNNWLLKISHEISKMNAKIWLKDSNISNAIITKEFEVTIDSKKIQEFLKLFEKLWYKYQQRSAQIRTNFNYKWTIVSLKHSKSRWYHCEVEINIDSLEKKWKAMRILNLVTRELKIKALSPWRIKSLCKKLDNYILQQNSKISPLNILASEKNLPLHQFLDYETILWIANNHIANNQKKLKITKEDISHFKKIIQIILNTFNIHKLLYWKKRIGTIHGILHHFRVILYTIILSKQKYKDYKFEFICICIALFHDIRRKDDKEDFGHWKRASLRLQKKNYIQELATSFNIKINKDDLKLIYKCIECHDTEVINAKDKFITDYIEILKTADALDRFRLPKTKRWINTDYLTLIPEKNLINFAHYLVVSSEISYLQWCNYFDSIFNNI